jgi:hypothetical protein
MGAKKVKARRPARHIPGMKSLVFASLVLAALAWADQPDDRAQIRAVAARLNAGYPSDLFTDDADSQLSRLSDLDGLLRRSGKPWSEVTAPRVVTQRIRFITKDVALVDAAVVQYGSTLPVHRVPLLLVMRREARGWRIASLRVLAWLPRIRLIGRNTGPANYCAGWGAGGGVAAAVSYLGPRPRPIRDSESILPVGSIFWSCWNRRRAATDASSQTPVPGPCR